MNYSEAFRGEGMLSGVKGLSIPLLTTGLLFFVLVVWLAIHKSEDYPLVNPRGAFEFTQGKVKQDFVRNGLQLLLKGLEKYNGRPFRVMTDHGIMTVLHPKYTHELRNIPELNHAKAIAKVSYSVHVIYLQKTGWFYAKTGNIQHNDYYLTMLCLVCKFQSSRV